MKTIILKYFFLTCVTLVCIPVLAQVKRDTVFNEYNKRIISITITDKNHKTVFTYNNYDPQFVLSKYEMIDDKLDGKYIKYATKDLVIQETDYKSGKKFGKDIVYKDGAIVSEISYQNDTLHGLSIKYYPSGLKQSSESYDKGNKRGECKYYYKSGDLSAISFFDTIHVYNTYTKKIDVRQVLDKKSETFYETGKPKSVTYYSKGKKNGESKEWYENGKLKSINQFKMDVLFGKQITYYSNGNTNQKFEVYYKYDSLKKYNVPNYEGEYLEYYENGKPKKIGYYKNYKKHGKWLEYYGDFLNIDSKYQNGFLVGNFISYHHNSGKIQQTAFYKLVKINKKDTSIIEGERIFYHENGKVRSRTVYENGICVKEQSYLNTGELVSDEYVKDGIVYKTRYYKNGKKEQEFIAKYNPLKDVSQQKYELQKSYYANGIVKEEKSTDLTPRAFKQEYNDSGMVIHKSMKLYDNQSLETYYYPTGVFKSEGISLMYHGRFRQSVDYFENGRPKSLSNYGLYKITWLSNGDLFRTQTFINQNENLPKDTMMDKDSLKVIYEALLKNQKRSVLNDLSDGIKTSYYAEGHPFLKTEIKDKEIVNFFTAYYFNGNKMLDFKLKNGKLEGEYTAYFENGRISEKGTYCEGLQCEKWIYLNFYGDTLKSFELKDHAPEHSSDKKYIYFKEYYGAQYSKKVVLKTLNIPNFIKEKSIYKSYHPNGNLYEDIFYDPSTKVKTIKRYWQNGKPAHISNYDSLGRKNGLYFEGKENGNPFYETFYVNDTITGQYKMYWPNGKLKFEGTYVKGVKKGAWSEYDSTGVKVLAENYENNKSDFAKAANVCNCNTKQNKIGFAQMVNSLFNASKANIWQFGFHTPITKYFDKMFFTNYQPSNDRNSGNCSMNIISYQELSTKLPNENGLEFILNPCVKIQKSSSLPISLSYMKKDPNSLSIYIYPEENVAFRFDESLLKPINTLLKKAEANFKAYSIQYSQQGLILNKPTNVCFTPSFINQTNAILSIDTFIPEVVLERYKIQFHNGQALNTFNKKDLLKQAGVSNGKGNLKNINDSSIVFNIVNLIVLNKTILGEIVLKESKENSKTYLVNGIEFSEKMVLDKLNKLLNNKAKVITNSETDRLVISFMISSEK